MRRDEHATGDAEELLRRAAIDRKLAFLLETERWPPERRTAWRDERLAALLEAAAASPFWRTRLRPGARLQDLPLLERETLQVDGPTLRAADGPTVARRTSGSTGRPVAVEHGAATVGFAAAARLRQRAWFGLPPDELPQANMRIAAGAEESALRRVRDDPPQFLVNPFALDERSVAAVHRELVAAGGVRLVGAESSLFARWASLYAHAGIDARELEVALGIVGGEMTYPDQRVLIERVFGCRVAEMYGSHEALMIATECPDGSLHLNEEVVWLEILRGDGAPAAPEELGEVAVTLLHNVEFPILRYRLGDVARRLPGECTCGRTLPRLDVELGRLEEMVRAPHGLLHPRFLRTTYERVFGASLRAFHTVQEDLDAFTLHVDLAEPPPPNVEAALAREISAYVGAPVTVRVVGNASGARTRLASGKLRTFTSRVS